jgi:DNA-binding LacI/PurR family transcriptional regulator
VRTRQGRKIESATETNPTAPELLASKIRDEIVAGTYRTGRPLPKFDYFVHTRGISRPTIAEAFRLLQSENLVHKIGKLWRVGPRLRKAEGSDESAAPVILLVVRAQKDWYDLFNNFFLLPFINSLRAECAAWRMRLSLLFTQKPLRRSLNAPWGSDGARQCARALKELLLGTIITDAFTGRDIIEAIARETSYGKRPIAYLDTSGARTDLDDLAHNGRMRFHRLYVDDQSAMRSALAALVAAGHRTIGFPTQGPDSPDWLVRRLETARALCRNEYPLVTLPTAEHTENFWMGIGEPVQNRFEAFAERLDALCGAADRTIETAQRGLLQATPSMADLLSRGMTALISWNDSMAYQHFLWCQNAGIAVPRSLSIISFDNVPESEVMPISTVDFGLGFLGYIAFHLLLGDIPIRFDAAGNIAGRCQLIDRGSIGRSG